MALRVSSDLLLVGSLPASSSEEALRTGGEIFGGAVFALPDGETGERAMWVSYEMMSLFEPHPDIEVMARTSSPDGVPRHIYDSPSFRVRPGVSEVYFDRWPRIDDAIDSYRIFRSLREQGVIPSSVRFQVGLPLTSSAITGAFRHSHGADYPVLQSAYEDLVGRELQRLVQEIPADDLAIQWDIAFEPLDLEGVLPWTGMGAWERFTGPSERLSPLVPEDVLLGYHLCYGTFPDWPMYEADDMSLLVRMANDAVRAAGRPVDWLHLAGPRHLRSEDDRFFRPLDDLHVANTQVYLGIVLPIDGAEGLRKRAATARRHLQDFGVAMYCGFGRQPGEDGQVTMRQHRDTADALRS